MSLRNRLLVRMSSVPDQPATARRLTLAVIGVVAVALGIWGWIAYRSDTGADIGVLAIAHGTWALFSSGGEIETVPWQLGMARLLAPLALAGAFIELALIAFAGRLRSFAARRMVGHVVLIGDSQRANAHRGLRDRPTVHVCPQGARGCDGTVVVPDDGTVNGWIRASNATAAARVVLSDEADSRGLARFTAAVHSGIPEREGSLAVELEDRLTALEVAIEMAETRPDCDIEVVCLDDSRAAFVAREMLDRIAACAGDDPGVPEVQPASGDERPPSETDLSMTTVAIIGDGPLSRLLVEHLSAGLTSLGSITASTRLRLVVVEPDPQRRAGIERQFSDQSRLDVTVLGDAEAVFGRTRGARWMKLLAAVDFVDADVSAQVAVRLASTPHVLQVWTPGEAALLPSAPGGPRKPDVPNDPRGQLTMVSHSAVEHAGMLRGPFARAAALHESDRAARSVAPAREPDPPLVKWDASQLRNAVRLLTERGLSLRASTGSHRSGAQHAEHLIDRETLAELGSAEGIALGGDADQLVHFLRMAGVSVTDPAEPPAPVTATAVEMPDDRTVEKMARAIHDRYRQSLRNEEQRGASHDRTGEPMPADRPWEDLGPALRGQNLDQARNNIMKLAWLGLSVTTDDTATGEPMELDEGDVEWLARLEHDRWCTQKRAQGYRLGSPRTDEGTDRLHPSLVAFDDLDRVEQDKDMDPIRDIPAVLASAGLRIGRKDA